MRYLTPILFLVAGIINVVPVSGALSGGQLDNLYRIGATGADIELLMRHRAVLFGIVGAMIMSAAFIPSLRVVATAAGLVSMVSFIALVFAVKNSNPNLVQIAWIDVGAIIVLLLGFGLHLAANSQTPPDL